MSLLWEYRDQLDGLRPLIEIAHWVVIPHIPPEDQDDVEQEIVIHLMQTVEKYGNKVGIDLENLDLKGKRYLWKVARTRRSKYLHNKFKKEIHYIDIGELIWVGSHDKDTDARLDAIATLATLPERLIQIGYKLLNGEKLSEADQHYRINQKARLRPKLNCRRYADRLSDGEKRRILRLHREGMSMCKIARTLGRTNSAVMRVLANHQPQSRQSWLAKMEMKAKEKAERIRHAYFVDGKSLLQIEREFHYGHHTVRRAIYGIHIKRR